MAEINCREIAPRCGGKREAFEELCCQIARRVVPPDASFVRIHGAGGDGGVECFADLADGSRIGWQAKYVFDVVPLLKQLTKSLETAIEVHESLTKYIVCFPFDLTGPTGRKDASGVKKFNEWKQKHRASARDAGRKLTIEAWPESRLVSELLRLDASGGMRAYFFVTTILSHECFEQHLCESVAAAGPRYTPELSVDTDLWKWFSALGQTSEWAEAYSTLLQECDAKLKHLVRAVKRGDGSNMSPAWPEHLRADGDTCVASLNALQSECESLAAVPSRDAAPSCQARLSKSLLQLSALESQLAEELDRKHGEGTADSPGFRQFSAQYMVSFPAANLDNVRDTIKAFESLDSWLNSPAGWPAFESSMLLLGAAGSGKTHGVCDAAVRRLEDGRFSLVLFGHDFRGEPEPWTRVRERLGLPPTLGRDGLLDALNSAAEASGNLLIIWIDAINETKPLRYWREQLLPFAEAVQRRPFLRLCATCRTSFTAHCIPETDRLFRAEHQGFAGIEREACQAFFAHYDLEPPVTPILQPELANPLYLRLVCETLQAKGLKRLPTGWTGLATAIEAFLNEKNRRFAHEHETTAGAAVVSRALCGVAREIAEQGVTALDWSTAEDVIRDRIVNPTASHVLDWLVREDLLIDEAPHSADALDAESVVRPAFERLGDFLIAQEVLSRLGTQDFNSACDDGPLTPFLGSEDAVANNEGVVSAISILIPEEFVKGTELPDLFPKGSLRTSVLKIAVSSFPWRHPSSFTSASARIIRDALATDDFAFQAMDAALAVSWQECAIDAKWTHALLQGKPMAARDAFWCGYLHKRYEELGPVNRLINAAFELPLDQVNPSIAERWGTMLLWFTAAADLRVKDTATRAATAVLRCHPDAVASVVQRMLEVDDDAVRERTLLVGFGACTLTRDASAIADLCRVLIDLLGYDPGSFHNALIRDHTRCISELAHLVGEDGVAENIATLLDGLESPWPLKLPSDEQIKSWDDLPKLAHSCLHDDFFIYSMGCLREWKGDVSKAEMGKWILRRIVEDFRYAGSGCERYDQYMLGSQGGGRGKPTWAERIGKKYQWIAMFQLAARLSDHVPPKRSDYGPELLREPLILLEERKLDPTLPHDIGSRDDDDDAWWIPITVDVTATAPENHSTWVQANADIPSFSALLEPVSRDGKQWRILVGYTRWGRRRDDAPYRQMWMIIQGYLVDPECVEPAFACLERRNFFGRWMPEGASWLYGFAGEFPWGPSYNTEPEDYHSGGGSGQDLPYAFTPVWNEVVAEWEYDASMQGSRNIHVPGRKLLEPKDLWWNGRDAFALLGGETVYRDPSVTEAGPPALIGSIDDLMERLRKVGRRLIWTLLGEKWILGEPHDAHTPGRTFSQVALLNTDGSIRYSDLVFFDN